MKAEIYFQHTQKQYHEKEKSSALTDKKTLQEKSENWALFIIPGKRFGIEIMLAIHRTQ